MQDGDKAKMKIVKHNRRQLSTELIPGAKKEWQMIAILYAQVQTESQGNLAIISSFLLLFTFICGRQPLGVGLFAPDSAPARRRCSLCRWNIRYSLHCIRNGIRHSQV